MFLYCERSSPSINPETIQAGTDMGVIDMGTRSEATISRKDDSMSERTTQCEVKGRKSWYVVRAKQLVSHLSATPSTVARTLQNPIVKPYAKSWAPKERAHRDDPMGDKLRGRDEKKKG